jgi:hypothetical protein
MAAREDFLEEDAEIPGQKVCLLSFLSPEKVLAKKDLFMFEAFLGTYEYSSRVAAMEEFLIKSVSTINAKLDAESDRLLELDLSGASEACRASRFRVDTVVDDLKAFIQKNDAAMRESKLKEAFDTFMYTNKAKLEDEFYAKNDFQTTVRGLKIRGVYSSQAEAVARSKKLQRMDTLHNIFLADVGKWLPWDPEPNDVKEQEYAEEELNTLMKKYKENEEAREQFQKENRGRLAKKPAAVDVSGAAEISTGSENPLAGSTLGSDVTGMFGTDGPADLAIARKMDKAGGLD